MKISRREFTRIAGGAVALQAFFGGVGATSGAALPESGDDVASLSLAEAGAKLRARQLSSVDLTRACIQRIDIYNRQLNAFITVAKPEALAAAERADSEMKAGRYRGPLHGIPFA